MTLMSYDAALIATDNAWSKKLELLSLCERIEALENPTSGDLEELHALKKQLIKLNSKIEYLECFQSDGPLTEAEISEKVSEKQSLSAYLERYAPKESPPDSVRKKIEQKLDSIGRHEFLLVRRMANKIEYSEALQFLELEIAAETDNAALQASAKEYKSLIAEDEATINEISKAQTTLISQRDNLLAYGTEDVLEYDRRQEQEQKFENATKRHELYEDVYTDEDNLDINLLETAKKDYINGQQDGNFGDCKTEEVCLKMLQRRTTSVTKKLMEVVTDPSTGTMNAHLIFPGGVKTTAAHHGKTEYQLALPAGRVTTEGSAPFVTLSAPILTIHKTERTLRKDQFVLVMEVDSGTKYQSEKMDKKQLQSVLGQFQLSSQRNLKQLSAELIIRKSSMIKYQQATPSGDVLPMPDAKQVLQQAMFDDDSRAVPSHEVDDLFEKAKQESQAMRDLEIAQHGITPLKPTPESAEEQAEHLTACLTVTSTLNQGIGIISVADDMFCSQDQYVKGVYAIVNAAIQELKIVLSNPKLRESLGFPPLEPGAVASQDEISAIMHSSTFKNDLTCNIALAQTHFSMCEQPTLEQISQLESLIDQAIAKPTPTQLPVTPPSDTYLTPQAGFKENNSTTDHHQTYKLSQEVTKATPHIHRSHFDTTNAAISAAAETFRLSSSSGNSSSSLSFEQVSRSTSSSSVGSLFRSLSRKSSASAASTSTRSSRSSSDFDSHPNSPIEKKQLSRSLTSYSSFIEPSSSPTLRKQMLSSIETPEMPIDVIKEEEPGQVPTAVQPSRALSVPALSSEQQSKPKSKPETEPTRKRPGFGGGSTTSQV